MEPLYRSDGEWVGVYVKRNAFNVDGEWLGFVVGKDLYDPSGKYVGYFSPDRRLLRTRSERYTRARLTPPPRPERPDIPAHMPLAPMLPALPYHIIDMFEEYPERLLYISDTRPDME